MKISSPYNFVPLNKEVFFPDWAESVSHDIPNGDALSGEISYTLKAHTPVIVAGPKNNNINERNFFKTSLGYTIPGTTMKGMIRSIIEIISFSKLSQINDETYSVRDLSNPNLYGNHMRNIQCGWLSIDVNNEWIIEDCGEPGRISHQEIDTALGTTFAQEFQYNPKDKSAKYKYEKVKQKNVPLTVQLKKGEKLRNGQCYSIVPGNSSISGTIVFTGQASKRMLSRNGKMVGKWLEFVFLKPETPVVRHIDPKVVKKFLFAYLDHDPKAISTDWAFWKRKLKTGEKIPVFFKLENKEVLHFGLSQLYKLPYKHSISEAMYPVHHASQRDFSEALFGYVNGTDALKGRVFFSPAIAHGNPKTIKAQSVVLNSPKASYYPSYVEQPNLSKEYKTYMDDDGIIRGFKRYPVRDQPQPIEASDKQKKVASTLIPLEAGTRFSGTIRFHNLRREELGALLYALDFNGHFNDCYHSIGMGKPYGYGVMKLESYDLSFPPYLELPSCDPKEYREAFVSAMDRFLEKPWQNHERIHELFAMSQIFPASKSTLRYMTIEPDNEFIKAKNPKDRSALDRYSHIVKASSPQPYRQQKVEAMSSSSAHIDKKPKQAQKHDFKTHTGNTVEAWQERVQRELANPSRSFKGILNDLKMNAQCYRGHVKEVATFLKHEFIKAGRWQEMEPAPNQRQDDYSITLRIKEFL